MASKSGANSGVILKPYLTFDSPSAPSTNDKMRIDSEAFSRGTTELTEAPVGGQVIMKTNSDIGDDAPGGTITKTLRSNDAYNAAIMNFFGTETVTTVTSGVYEHSAVANTTSLVNYLLFAKETDTANVEEYVNAVMTELALEFNPNQYVKSTGTFKASKRLITGTTSSNANITSATEPTNYNFIFRDTDWFRYNAQAGAALSGSDNLAITSASISLTRDYEFVAEARGSAGKSAPRVAGEPPFIGSLSITLKEKDGNTFWTAHDAGTEYKASIQVVGPVISGGHSHTFRIDFPRLKVVTEPQYNLSSSSVNPVTIEFQCLAATANPTGMGSIYPMVVLKNEKLAKYLA